MPIDQNELRRVMGHFATGVTVITTISNDGKHYGLTANAFTSVSLEPPLLLISVDKKAESYPLFARSRVFAVNILTQKQETLSRRFAKSGGEKFEGVGYRAGATGAPILEGALAHLECEIRHEFDAGDHTIFVGVAVEIGAEDAEEPLLYFRGGYRNLGA